MAQYILSAFADEASDSIDGQIKALKRNGIAYIELRNVSGESVSYMDVEKLNKLRGVLDENGICVSSLGSPIGKYPITEDFEPHLKQFYSALNAAQILGAKYMRMFSFFVDSDKLKLYRDEVIRRLNIMIENAQEKGIALCHENEHGIYGQMPKQVSELLKSLPNLRSIFDAANYRMDGADALEGFSVSEPSLAYLHIKDAIYESKTIVPAGEGEGHIKEILDELDKKTDREVFLSVEPHLRLFGTYTKIDSRDLHSKYMFATNDESFDYAVNSLKNILNSLGFKENEEKRWMR